MEIKSAYMDYLKYSWKASSQAVKLRNKNEVFKDVVSRYTQPHRHYHNLMHILKSQVECYLSREIVSDINTMSFAIWMHDVIYDKNGNNESRSIEYVNQLKMPQENKSKISKLIQVTDHKTTPETSDEKIIADIDLSVFGYHQKFFEKYENDIRLEYINYSDKEFREGRIHVLNYFLNREIEGKKRIYYTDRYYNKYEKTARENLERSVRKLGGNVANYLVK
ncbi:MAG TPA: hypothetical protein VEC16_03735 [Alphaproteobacteria bacterium]|nr:hypothetical protein [Alphaproteobacteria bacterium]